MDMILLVIFGVFAIAAILSLEKEQKTYLEKKWDRLVQESWFFWFACAKCRKETTLDPFLLLPVEEFREHYIQRKSFRYEHTCQHCGEKIELIYHRMDPPPKPLPPSNNILIDCGKEMVDWVRRRDGGHYEIIDGIIVFIPFEQGVPL